MLAHSTEERGKAVPAHRPHGNQLAALEKNILKYRAFEMILIIFHVDTLKSFALEAIQTTDAFDVALGNTQPKLPKDAKKKYEKVWAILVADGVLTQAESDKLQKLIDYRNRIAHSIVDLTGDLSPIRQALMGTEGESHYDYDALRAIKQLSETVYDGMRSKYVLPLSFKNAFFRAAEQCYEQELSRLKKRIDRQMQIRTKQRAALRGQFRIARAIRNIQLGHPTHFSASGRLSKNGILACRELFSRDLSPLAVSYLMRISYRASARRFSEWQNMASSSSKS